MMLAVTRRSISASVSAVGVGRGHDPACSRGVHQALGVQVKRLNYREGSVGGCYTYGPIVPPLDSFCPGEKNDGDAFTVS